MTERKGTKGLLPTTTTGLGSRELSHVFGANFACDAPRSALYSLNPSAMPIINIMQIASMPALAWGIRLRRILTLY